MRTDVVLFVYMFFLAVFNVPPDVHWISLSYFNAVKLELGDDSSADTF